MDAYLPRPAGRLRFVTTVLDAALLPIQTDSMGHTFSRTEQRHLASSNRLDLQGVDWACLATHNFNRMNSQRKESSKDRKGCCQRFGLSSDENAIALI